MNSVRVVSDSFTDPEPKDTIVKQWKRWRANQPKCTCNSKTRATCICNRNPAIALVEIKNSTEEDIKKEEKEYRKRVREDEVVTLRKKQCVKCNSFYLLSGYTSLGKTYCSWDCIPDSISVEKDEAVPEENKQALPYDVYSWCCNSKLIYSSSGRGLVCSFCLIEDPKHEINEDIQIIRKCLGRVEDYCIENKRKLNHGEWVIITKNNELEVYKSYDEIDESKVKAKYLID